MMVMPVGWPHIEGDPVDMGLGTDQIHACQHSRVKRGSCGSGNDSFLAVHGGNARIHSNAANECA